MEFNLPKINQEIKSLKIISGAFKDSIEVEYYEKEENGKGVKKKW